MEQLVSAIITSYKRAPEIVCGAIESVLQQSYSNIEIIVVDDNADESVESKMLSETLAAKYPMVQYRKQNGNKGACAARNLGLAHAKGEYVAFLDDDDRWLSEKIERQVLKMQSEAENVGMVYCTGRIIYQDGQPQDVYYNYKRFKETVSLAELLCFDYVGSTSQPLMRKKCFDAVGGFDENQPARQDYEMWIRIATKYKIVGIKEFLFEHHIHAGEQISKSKEKAFIGYKNIYKKYRKDYRANVDCHLAILDYIISCKNKNDSALLGYRIKRKLLLLLRRK